MTSISDGLLWVTQNQLQPKYNCYKGCTTDSQSLNNIGLSPNAQEKLALRSHDQFKASHWSTLNQKIQKNCKTQLQQFVQDENYLVLLTNFKTMNIV